MVTCVLVEAGTWILNTWIRLAYVTLFTIHGCLDTRCLLMVERCEAVVDIPKVDATGSRTKTSARIMMGLLEATISQENFEVGTEG